MVTGTATPRSNYRMWPRNYGSLRTLKDISLTVEPGEVVAVLSPNGADKSTSIALMPGMHWPSSVTLFAGIALSVTSYRTSTILFGN